MTVLPGNFNISFKIGSIFFIIILMVFSISGFSQESCTQKLEKAEKLYESGQINEVKELLDSCLNKGFLKDEKARAYRILTLCNLYYNQQDEAKQTFLELLKVDKEYKIKEADPSEFITLHKEFRTDPVFITGIKIGRGFMDINSITNYNDINSVANERIYKPGNTTSIGLSFETPVKKNLSVVYEFLYSQYSYSYNDTVLNYAAISYNEDVKGLDIPILGQWNFIKIKDDFVPYVNLGASFNILLSSGASILRQDNEGEQYREDLNIDNIDLKNSRNKFNYGITAGAGFRWKNFFGNGYLTFDMRYSKYLKNNVESSNRAENLEIIYSGLTTDNSFKMSNIQFLIGYKLPFYIPKYKGK